MKTNSLNKIKISLTENRFYTIFKPQIIKYAYLKKT